jgi:hypothetical protein
MELVAAGSILAAKEAGKYRLEGRDYAVRDGDVMIFRCNLLFTKLHRIRANLSEFLRRRW